MTVVSCHLEVSETNQSLVQNSRTYCGASLCVIQKPRELGDVGPLGGGAVAPKMNLNIIRIRHHRCYNLE